MRTTAKRKNILSWLKTEVNTCNKGNFIYMGCLTSCLRLLIKTLITKASEKITFDWAQPPFYEYKM